MIVADRFLYTRVIESDGRAYDEFTFAGASIALIATTAVVVVAALALFYTLSSLGISF
jgi:hypothetical protein